MRISLAWFGICLLLMAPLLAHAVDIYLADGSVLGMQSPEPKGARPVLFVHGHKLALLDPEPHYLETWKQSLDSTLRSFGETLEHPDNAWLDLEPYYLNFGIHARSMVEDARDIGEAVERILARHHDPAELPLDERHPPRVQVTIIAYSKGTISTRLYLKSLQQQQYTLPPPRPSFHPVSEFVAIAPPNHGLKTQPLATTAPDLAIALELFVLSTPGQQLHNGFLGTNCARIFPSVSSSLHFMRTLNGHAMADSHLSHFTPAADYPTEAPGSRLNGKPTTDGTLYVTLYDAADRDSVGGEVPVINDCTTSSLYGALLQGRRLARNLAAMSVNLPVPDIPGNTPVNPDPVREALTVHQQTVHFPDVICTALFTAVYRQAPDVVLSCTVSEGIPLIPR